MKLLKQFFVFFALLFGALLLVAVFAVLLIILRQTFPLTEEDARYLTRKESNLPKPNIPTKISIQNEAVVIVAPPPTPTVVETTNNPSVNPTVETVLSEYLTVTDGCGVHFEGECLNVRSGPGTEYPSVAKLRTGVVLKVSERIQTASSTWYKIVFDEWLRYPERVTSNWYISAEHVTTLSNEGDLIDDGTATSTKRIIVDRSEQKLYAFDGETLFMETIISTGLELTPTPRGTFTIFKKTPSRYMQGPLPYLAVSKYYDLPGVPWNLYFTEHGAVIHGAYWHNSFGRQYSSGCVNMDPEEARTLYTWAELGTTVTVRD